MLESELGEPAIGWFMLSEADRSAANKFLAEIISDGTRDELGFAPIHFAFADRFFPGTSVQHAQLRYVFFVAWTYQELLQSTPGERFPRDRLREVEERYSRRLMKSVEQLSNSGISGWMKYRAEERPVVRASTIYWTALRSWRMANTLGGSTEPPTEVQLQSMWPRLQTQVDSEERQTSVAALFDDLPPPPPGWRNKTGQLEFALRTTEAEYLRLRWKAAGGGVEPPLLSKLTEEGVTANSLWAPEVRAVANQSERDALVLAEQAASLACIARAIHSALIEIKRNDERGLADSRHQSALPELIDEHRDAALRLDVDALKRATAIDRRLVCFIGAVLEWLRERQPLDAISKVMGTREHELKGGRAYLVSEKRRVDWRKSIAVPLDYRWPTVRTMINRVLEAA
ncbi:hypothetical protein J2X36_002728 [Methylobacterium sp. BE186]|uniref:DUF6361 family protein n=1 Tax=Methylobacterium sp. BE186 TaxID=2817715 RepID=UPI0028628555|nr:DUF6361 family protein [Methylobacterium sp. BE186]MDR7037973.1 hypothetical protein [Methylobacterium sp. BE186]